MSKKILASSGFFDFLIIEITSSIFSIEINNPIKTKTLSLAFFNSNKDLLIMVFSLNFKKVSMKSIKDKFWGRLSFMASVLNPNELSSGEYL